MKDLPAIVLFIIFTLSSAWAQNCSEPLNQKEMNICAKFDFEQTDQELNNYYKRIVSKLDNEGIENLKTAQRAWIKYRDANCEAVSHNYRGGSMEPLIKYTCLKVITGQRSDALRIFYEDQLTDNN